MQADDYVICSICYQMVQKRELHRHRVTTHHWQIGGANLQPFPFQGEDRPFRGFPDEDDLYDIYKISELYILRPHLVGQEVRDLFNFPVRGRIRMDDLEQQMRTVYAHEQTANAYKLNFAVGVILRNNRTNEYRYFQPGENAYLFSRPYSISDRRELENAIQSLRDIDLEEKVRQFRLNSEWQPVFITQIEHHIWKQNHVLGSTNDSVVVPDFIKNHRWIKTRFDYTGYSQCCMFVALSHYKFPDKCSKRHKRSVRELMSVWFTYCEQNGLSTYQRCEPNDFSGIEWKDLPHFEDCFQISIEIFELQSNDIAIPRWSSTSHFPSVMYLNITENEHCMLITSIQNYCHKFSCPICQRLFKTQFLAERHRRTCGQKSQYIFPRGCFQYHKDIFTRLEEVNVTVPQTLRQYTHFIVYDYESLLLPRNITSSTGQTTYRAEHRPISCALASNHPRHQEPVCYIDSNPYNLIGNVFEAIDNMRASINNDSRNKWGCYLGQLRERLSQRRALVCQNFEQRLLQKVHDEYSNMQQTEDNPEKIVSFETFKEKQLRKYLLRDPLFAQLLKLYKDFYLYIYRVPILSFHGKGYDIPLSLPYMMKHLLSMERMGSEADRDMLPVIDSESELQQFEVEEEQILQGRVESEADLTLYTSDFRLAEYLDLERLHSPGRLSVIKRNNHYICVNNNYYSFLDVTSWLPPQTTYKAFLQCYGAEGEKLIFPYNFLTSPEVLEQSLPPYDHPCWVDNLHGGMHQLERDFLVWQQNGQIGNPPKNGRELYRQLQLFWQTNGFTKMSDLLIAYNSADVKPFCQALTRLMNTYFDLQLDILKVSCSIPGLSRLLLFRYSQEKGALFPLFGPKNQDLFWNIKAQLTGGASIVFDRFCQAGVTHVHPDGRDLVQTILGLDCTSMYLGMLQYEFSSFMMVRRLEEEQFKPRYDYMIYAQHAWIIWMQKQLGIPIKSKLTCGVETRVGSFLADGMGYAQVGHEQVGQRRETGEVWRFMEVSDNTEFCGRDETRVILEFLGCHFHGHIACEAGRKSPLKDAYAKWLEKKAFLQQECIKLYAIWECEFKRLLNVDDDLYAILHRMTPSFLKKHRKGVDQSQILDACRRQQFHGLIQVDINVNPQDREKFQSFPPLFANHIVTSKLLGSEMKQYCTRNNISIGKRRLLLTGMEAKGILLTAALLCFYMELGLEVTRVYEATEFVPTDCFKGFVDTVTKGRKQAAQAGDIQSKIKGQAFKLLGTRQCHLNILCLKLFFH